MKFYKFFLILLTLVSMSLYANTNDEHHFIASQVSTTSILVEDITFTLKEPVMLEYIAVEIFKKYNPELIELYYKDHNFKSKVHLNLKNYINSKDIQNKIDENITDYFMQNYELDELKSIYHFQNSTKGQILLKKILNNKYQIKNQLDIEYRNKPKSIDSTEMKQFMEKKFQVVLEDYFHQTKNSQLDGDNHENH